MTEHKKISFAEALNIMHNSKLTDNRSEGDNADMRGIVTLIDDASQKVIFRGRPNIIVLRGRVFALEKLFDDTIASSGVNGGAVPYISDLDRKIIGFGVGRGGAPGSAPFEPYAPVPMGTNGVQLADAIPFRTHDTMQSTSGDPLLFIPANEIAKYGAAELVSGTTTEYNYFFKHFDQQDPEWFFDEALNTVYKKIIMKISVDDCRTDVSNWVNELCLYFGRQEGLDARGGSSVSNVEMFSRITFPTEYLSANKSLTVEYQIFA